MGGIHEKYIAEGGHFSACACALHGVAWLRLVAQGWNCMKQLTGFVRYIDHGNGTVTDKQTGLMWQQRDDGEIMDWYAAKSYSKNLVLSGFTDWRLPDIDELKSLIKNGVSPTIDSVYFPGTQMSHFWSSTSYIFNSSFAWIVGFSAGLVAYRYKTLAYYVRCVRGGL